MAFVLDASVAVSWFLPDEQSEATEGLITLLADNPAQVPRLFWYETRNIFMLAERHGRLGPGAALASMLKLRTLPLHDGGGDMDVSVIGLSLRHNLSGYDASYIALAKYNKMPLATLDKKMAVVARTEGIAIAGPLSQSA